MITPTVARMVHFHPQSNSIRSDFTPTALCAAIVCFVHDDNKTLNLSVYDKTGRQHAVLDVPLIQDDETPPADGYYASWMPYQVAVSKGEIPAVLHADPK